MLVSAVNMNSKGSSTSSQLKQSSSVSFMTNYDSIANAAEKAATKIVSPQEAQAAEEAALRNRSVGRKVLDFFGEWWDMVTNASPGHGPNGRWG